jgi:hypothetical protein
MATARVRRGRKTQQLIANYWRAWWPGAWAVEGAMTGRDIKGMVGYAPEIKATADGDLLSALRQARRNAGADVPFVVWRPNGYGEGQLADWVMAFTVQDGTAVLVELMEIKAAAHELRLRLINGYDIDSLGNDVVTFLKVAER